MGTYAITLNDYSTKFGELFNRFYAVINTYSTGNKYRHQELVTYKEDNSIYYSYNTVWWNEAKQEYQWLAGMGGGGGKLLGLNDSDEWVVLQTINNSGKALGPPVQWVYSKKLDKYYGLSAGLGEWDNTFTPTDKGYTFADGSSSLIYDTKRDYVVCQGSRFDGVAGKWLIQLDPNGEETTEPVFGLQMARNYLYETTANRAKFLNYSSRDDMYYYADENKIIKVNPDTGVGSVILTKGTDIVGMLIEEGSGWIYYGYVDNDNIKLARFYYETPANLSQEVNLGDITHFYIAYVGKTVVINCRKSFNNADAWYTVAFNLDLSLDLTREKYMYHNHIPNSTTKDDVIVPMISSNHSSKQYIIGTFPQKFKPLGNDEVDIHIPVHMGGGAQNRSSTKVLNINPVTAYPVVTDPTVTDCCLDELKCEINTKLAKKSCEATNRAIVGRHYGCMFDDAELLEALLWITTFDCLTCDEIENLRCITSKI